MGGVSKKAIKLEKGIYQRAKIEVRMKRNGESFYVGGLDTIEEAREILADFIARTPKQPNTGKDNNAMRGGIAQSSLYNFLAFRKEVQQNSMFYCRRCGEDKLIKYLNVHHIDHDRTNDTEENFEILCSACHREHHNTRGKDGKFQ